MGDINELPNTLIPLSSSHGKKRRAPASPRPRSVGRPLKRTSALRLGARERNSRVQQLVVHRRHARTHEGSVEDRRTVKKSTIESLPHEIIQEIFFKADMEVNLARASRYLGEALSVESIYLSTIATAFFDDDTEGPIVEEYFKPAGYSHINLEQKIRLQRNLMTCRWFNQERLEKCLPRLVHLKVCQVRAREIREQNSLGLSADAIANPYYQGVERKNILATVPEADDEKGLTAHYRTPCNFLYTAEESFHHRRRRPPQQQRDSNPEIQSSDSGSDSEDKEKEQVSWPPVPRIWTWKCWSNDDGKLHKEMDRGVSVLAVRVMPDKFLNPPRWTSEKIGLLKLLRQGMRFVEHDQVLEISAEALFKGLGTALRQRNEEATLVLLELHYATMRVATPQVEEEPAPANPTARQPRYHDLVGPFVHPLPRSLISDALPPEGSKLEFDSTTMRLLSYMISEGIDSIEHRSQLRRLSRWAINAANSDIKKVEELGRWVVGQMFRTIDHGPLRDDDRLFVNGRLSTVNNENTKVPWPWTGDENITFTKRLGYDTEGVEQVTVLPPPTAPDGGPCGGTTRIPLTWDPPPKPNDRGIGIPPS